MAVSIRRHKRNPYGDEEELNRQALLHQMEQPPSSVFDPTDVERLRQNLAPRERPTPDRSLDDFMQPDMARTHIMGADTETPDFAAPMAPTSTGAAPSNRGRGLELLDAYDDPYERRNEGAGGVWSNAAKYAQTGASVGSAFAGVGAIPGAIIGGIGGAIGGAFSKNAKTAMTDFAVDDARAIISKAHEDAFGREIDPKYLDEILRGQGWQQGDRWMGEASLSYVLDQFAQHALLESQSAPGAPAATAPAASAPGIVATGAAPGGRAFTGFDFAQDAANRDPQKSAKYAYALAVQNAPALTDSSKEGAEAWFRQHITPALEAAGHKVYDVVGDKAWIGSKEDPEGNIPVDYLKNAGLDSAEFAWQPETGSEGGAGGGAVGKSGATNAQDAYSYLTSVVSPNASKEEMEAAITAAFGDVPGFEKAYKESVMINGQWYDLVQSYGGDGAKFQGLQPKVDGPRASGGGSSLLGQSSALTNSLVPTDNDFYLRLLREVQDIANGGRGGTMDRDALVNLMKAA